MNKNIINIEIAELPFEVIVEDLEVYSFLQDELKGFSSTQKPYFSITIENVSEYTRGVELNGMEIVQEENIVTFYTQDNSQTLLGHLNKNEKKAVFMYRPQSVIKQYIVPFLRIVFQTFLFPEKGFLIHACGLGSEEQGALFTGPSGCGKTTISGILHESNVLSDEFVCIREVNNKYYMYSTPWRKFSHNKIKLDKICFPKKNKELVFDKISPAEAVREIMPNILCAFHNQDVFKNILDMLFNMTGQIPCYNMGFALDSPIEEGINCVT